MEIILDMREKKLYTECFNLINANDKLNNIVLKSENLALGDAIIKYNKEEKIIIERKSITDLISSIKDKRYEEQSFRLDKVEHHNHNIIYLIEGRCDKYVKEKQMIYSSIFCLSYFKGFSVFRSIDICESAYIICNIMLKISIDKNKHPYYLNPNSNTLSHPTPEPVITIKINDDEKETKDVLKNSYLENRNETDDLVNENSVVNTEEDDKNKEYCGLVMKKKNAMITTDNISEIMLCQIPGVSKVFAIEILKKFDGSINKLICSLNENPNCIDNIYYIIPNSQKTRKISKTSINNIIKYLQIIKK